jgi:hypothetical protein
MTEGEKMVWASAYTNRLQYWRTRPRVQHETDESWERFIHHDAMEHASHAVSAMGTYRGSLQESYGENSTVFRRLLAMSGLPEG